MRSLSLVAVACALTALVSGAAGCKRTDLVGSLGCATSRDCLPPDTICSADGRCVAGCIADPADVRRRLRVRRRQR